MDKLYGVASMGGGCGNYFGTGVGFRASMEGCPISACCLVFIYMVAVVFVFLF